MNSRVLSLSGCLAVLAGAAGFVLWGHDQRSARLREVSQLGSGVQPEAESPTGYARGVRNLVVPELQHATFQWIPQAQLAMEESRTRVRWVTYDNAPAGRATHLASPYRWWLEALTGFDEAVSGRPRGAALENVTLQAGPALQFVLFAFTAAFIAWRFGAFAAGLVGVGLLLLFPLSGLFLPGHPDDGGLRAGVGLWSVLLLYPGLGAAPGVARRWWIAAGAVGGFGLWVNVASQLPFLGGVIASGLVLAWRKALPPLPWRAWGVSAALVAAAGWLVEYAPSHLGGLRLEANHPLHALAVLGGAELVRRLSQWRVPGQSAPARPLVGLGLAAAAILALPVALLLQPGRIFPGAAAQVNQLTVLAGGISAENLGAWLSRDGFSLAAWSALSPLLLLTAAAWAALRRTPDSGRRVGLLLALGPAIVLAALGCVQLHWWGLFDGALLALLAGVLAGAGSGLARAAWIAGATAVLLPGLFLLRPPPALDGSEVTADEVDALVTRDLGHWLARRTPGGGAIVLAPPALTASLTFYGGFRGITTPWWENRDGFAAAVRIAGATSADEALALVQRRQITHVVVPSWDDSLEQYARLGGGEFDRTLAGLLRQWLPPRWLRPIPYQLPGIAGLEGRSVRVFEVVEAQDNPTALGRLAEYFLETGQPQLAAAVAASLQQAFPHELGALAARAHVAFALREGAALQAALAAVDTALREGADEILPWERRVSLALALAQARRLDQARAMMTGLLAGADDERLRSLTPGTLYRLIRFNQAAGIDFPDPAQRERAAALLPAEWRERI